MVNSHLVCDPTIWQPGFDLSRQQWSLLNHFFMEQGHLTIWFCHSACTRKWRLADTDLYPCGETQTMSDIVKSCHLTKLNGSLPGYTLQMKMLFPGWPIMGHHTHTRRRRLSPRHKSWSFMQWWCYLFVCCLSPYMLQPQCGPPQSGGCCGCHHCCPRYFLSYEKSIPPPPREIYDGSMSLVNHGIHNCTIIVYRAAL